MKFVFLALFSFQLFAFEQVIKHDSYETAGLDAASGAIQFASESTKFGLVTTSFYGRALEFDVKGSLKKDQVEGVVVTVPVRKVTTDSSGRDEKMWDEILNEKTYPTIQVTFPTIQHGHSGPVAAQITVKGQSYPLSLNLATKLEEGKLYVKGTGGFSLKALNVPDPSIAIAKVRDQFDLNFQIVIQ